MTITKRQHYVPRVYLRSWGDENGNIKVLDKIKGKAIYPNVENICLEKYYYEHPELKPTNELEKKFGEFESVFGKTRDFLSFVENSAIKLKQPIAQTLADSLIASPKHVSALKNFAGTTYFRTPAAISAMKKALSSDNNPIAKKALEQIDSPYTLNTMAFESTLLERFKNLHIALMYSEHRLNTSDWPCFPVIGGSGHANFGYDIGRHEAASALMTVTPKIVVMFLPNLDNIKPFIRFNNMPKKLADEHNQLVHEMAERWVIK